MTLVQDAATRNRFAPARSAWRNLLVHVQPETQARPRLESAVDLARKLDAQLVGIGAEMLPPMAASDPSGMLGGEFITLLQETISSNLKNAAAAFETQARAVAHTWRSTEDMPGPAMSRLAREADLVIVGGSPLEYEDRYRWCDPAELAIQCGRPVLVVPPAGGRLQASSVVVAWKDTREARRALLDSLPILKCADQVLVVAVCEADERDDEKVHTASVLEYLLRHGVEAQAKVVSGSKRGVYVELQDAAGQAKADLIVSGAYGHSRMGEWMFGGVTSDLLSDPRRFLLLSH